ncbi:glycoside hydrolase family 35 protein [Cohnella zeiphila]|uniref:Beta-galactosidase n=1 Tax=Cohnella zeiphila TaxID=2761120 RepID=A0A7X0SKN8_9BACL|nr:beta-galactosidase [Cohnella zeiphila]MBB6729513.1 beta-galactosidase [Cohnella zeiphila]
MGLLTMRDGRFYRDGALWRMIGGAMHYFRIVPDYWEDRLRKLKACGFNTVETYVAWNVHEPKEGRFRFDGTADVERFVRLAGRLGLSVVLRPSPYICAEWEFGGLPSWLLADPGMRLRCSYPPYLEKVAAYYDELLPRLKPLLATSGGPIVALQIENEYGSYGNDKNYLTFLKNKLISGGMDVPLFTSDGTEDYMLQGGTLEDTLITLNFGSNPERAFERLGEYQQGKPLVCMEYWNGWFDHWGDEHHVRGHEDVVDVLDRILGMGASVNFYMFHGGTNFGFFNGANHIEFYEPTVTSYDYNALLSESGDITDKYLAIREVIGRYAELPDEPLPPPARKLAYGEVRLTERARLFDSFDRLGEPVSSVYPETMERLGQDYGFIWYETFLSGPRPECEIILQEVRDRALIYLDGVYQGVLERWGADSVTVDVPAGGAKLGILVENMGRINYGSRMRDVKGITEGVKAGKRLYHHFLFDWTIRSLPMDDLSGLRFERLRPDETDFAAVAESERGEAARDVRISEEKAAEPEAESDSSEAAAVGPAFYRGTFHVEEAADTFLKLEGWTKGVAYVNGFNLGRYWEKGPQRTLYVPGPLLRAGENELVLFELHGAKTPIVTLQDFAELG